MYQKIQPFRNKLITTMAVSFPFTDYKLEDFSNTTLAGLPAKKIVFSYLGEYKGQDQYIRSLSVTAISGSHAYEISYTSPRLEFDDLMPAVPTNY